MKTKTDKNPKGAGRSTDYDPVFFIDKLDEYLDTRKDTADPKSKNGYRVQLPTIEGFAYFLGVTRKTLYNWADAKIEVAKDKWEIAHPEVEEALDTIKQEQLQRLIDEGLGGNYNPAITKLLLSHNHQIKEETISEVKSEVTNKFDDKQLSRIAERIASRGGSIGNLSGKEKSN